MAGDEHDGGSFGFDVTVAHPARVYNYLLGGKDNFEADREAARQMIAGGAKVLAGVRANRAFLGRAVRFLAGEAGIRQFLDIGTGLPTADNTHEVAQAMAPESRIVYVDNDPICSATPRRCYGACPAAPASMFTPICAIRGRSWPRRRRR